MSALSNPPFASVEEYLHSSYSPDCEYVDGEIQERCLGEYEHSKIQIFFAYLFRVHSENWKATVFAEYRVQVAPTRFRVPDITVIRAAVPRQAILRTPPMLVVEILSPEDTWKRLGEKVSDYLRFGAEHIWVVDPNTQRAYVADAHGFHEPADGSAEGWLTIPGTPIAVSLAELWRELA